MSLSDYQHRLVKSGLMTPEEAERSRLDLVEWLGEGAADATSQDWGKRLVQKQRATLFQISAIQSGRPSSLIFGEYELQDKLATGGMGDVFRAVHRGNGTWAAVKILPASAAGDPELVQRFEREIRLLSEVKHPNIVGAFDAGEGNGCQFLAMEYVDGSDLGRLIKHKGAMPAEDAVECIRQAALGLAYAHERSVVHRDVKPSNLMLDHHGVVKILDLGLARILQSDEGLTSTGSVMGSIDYMAPEQGNDSKIADHRADIYALGCTLFYLMTGRIVFDARNISQKLLAHQDQPAPPLTDFCPATAPQLDQLYLKMLAKNPDDRPRRMQHLLAVLAKIQRDLPEPDLTRYVRGSSARRRGASNSTAAPTAANNENGEPAPLPPLASLPQRRTTTRTDLGNQTAACRVWLGGAAAAALTVCLAAYVVWTTG